MKELLKCVIIHSGALLKKMVGDCQMPLLSADNLDLNKLTVCNF